MPLPVPHFCRDANASSGPSGQNAAVRWPRYSEHPWLQKVRVASVVLAVSVLLIALVVGMTR